MMAFIINPHKKGCLLLSMCAVPLWPGYFSVGLFKWFQMMPKMRSFQEKFWETQFYFPGPKVWPAKTVPYFWIFQTYRKILSQCLGRETSVLPHISFGLLKKIIRGYSNSKYFPKYSHFYVWIPTYVTHHVNYLTKYQRKSHGPIYLTWQVIFHGESP